MKDKYKKLIETILRQVEPKYRLDFLFNLKCAFWGYDRTDKQEDILERYDYEEYWRQE